MKNAEMELVRVGGDVIMTSGGGGGVVVYDALRYFSFTDTNETTKVFGYDDPVYCGIIGHYGNNDGPRYFKADVAPDETGGVYLETLKGLPVLSQDGITAPWGPDFKTDNLIEIMLDDTPTIEYNGNYFFNTDGNIYWVYKN